MNNGSFDGGLLNLTNWKENAVMPLLAALILALGIYKYSRGYHIDPYIGGTMAALSVSGLLRLAEVFARQGSGTRLGGPAESAKPGSGNAILPVYGGIEIARAVLGIGGVFEKTQHRRRLDPALHRRRQLPVRLRIATADERLHRNGHEWGGMMALKMSSVSRNLHAKVTTLGLELEDMLALAMGCAIAMLIGEFLFPDRYMFFLPMNWFLMLMVLVLGVPD